MPTRRRFVQGSLALGAALAPVPRVARLARPTDELRVAVVGLEGRGAVHVAALAALPGVRLMALCDVDELVLLREVRKARERDVRPASHADYRNVLERDDVDAVVLATPDHWHAVQAIWACQAGKDVYLEAPATHFFSEGPALARAVEHHGRVLQCGLQARSCSAIDEALRWMRAGNLGTPELVHAVCFEPRPSLGRTSGNQRPPDSVDYDRWCGPAPLLPLRRARLHHDWRWFYANGVGELGDRGAHVLDLARRAAVAEELPPSVRSVGMRAVHDDDGETPNSLAVFFGYEPLPILLEVRGLPRDGAARAASDWSTVMDAELGLFAGAIVRCTGGTLVLHEEGALARDAEGAEVRRWEGTADALSGWLEACRTRRAETLTAPIATGVRSAALGELATVSHRTGRRTERAAIEAEVAGKPCLATGCERLFTHLDAHGVELGKPAVVLGAELVLDGATGTYSGHERVAEMLAGTHREPYGMPA